MVDCEHQLLAAWILGYNQEHIKEFDYFTCYPELFEAVSKMETEHIDMLKVSKATGIKVAKVAEFVSEHMPSLYDGYYRMKKEEKIKDMLERAVNNPSNISDQLTAIMKEMDKLQASHIKPPADLIESYRNEIERRKTSQPLKYGLPTLDYITGGLRRQELTVIAARPSIGKTALALQIAFNLSLKKYKTLFFPLEMSGYQLLERIACRETDIKHERLKTPAKMDEKDNEELNNFFEIYKPIIKPYLNIIEGVSNLTDIKRHIEHYKPEVIFIDQLSQLRENKKFGSTREQFTYMTNELKKMTKDLDTSIILLAQINREAQNREPKISDIKESGSIEEDADNIIMLHQTDDSTGTETPVSIIIGKQRNGQRDVKIPAIYMNKKFIFREIAK